MKQSKKDGGSSRRIVDERFASFETDPRYRLPSKNHTKTTIDKRFSRVLKDDEFTSTTKIDRYGRKLKSDSKKKALQRLYQEEGEEGDGGGGGEEDETEVEDDDVVKKELEKAQKTYDPARGGGFSSSDEEEDSEEDDDLDEEDGGAEITVEGDIQRLQDEAAEVEVGEVTRRIAIVNLDWDYVRSPDLMALFSSFLPPGTKERIENVSIYPSEFGKERMQREELEGPPKELFQKDTIDELDTADEDEGERDEDERIKNQLLTEGDDQDFDSDALRKYQLDRLRYYYAVMVCSDSATAKTIYEATDGTEYQSSSNFIDLRFVPDEVTFEDEPRDSCNRVPESYKPVEFVTNALQSSKVKLTWDMHPEETSRKEAQKRAFTGSRTDIEENDLKAYLASDSEESEVGGRGQARADDAVQDTEPKLSKKELARQKMREALGLGEEPAARPSKEGPVGDMQITFTPALSEKSKPRLDEGETETTMEKYMRKEKEKKNQKRQKAKAKREGQDPHEGEDDAEGGTGGAASAEEDLGFNDPFFTTEDPIAPSKTSIRKEERRKKREDRAAAEAASATERAHLKKIMSDNKRGDEVDHLEHFDMSAIVKAEKAKKKKGKFANKGKNAFNTEERGGLQEAFQMDVGDERFKAVFENHEYAIDPTNPRFKSTDGMNKLLEESRRKRQIGDEGGNRERKKKKKSNMSAGS